MDKKKLRLADIFIAFDKEDSLSYLKITGQSALQFLISDTNELETKIIFDFESNLDTTQVSELRKNVAKELPRILQKKSFSIDNKKTEFGPSYDLYTIKDDSYGYNYEIYIDYLNRYHVLKSEFFSRKDDIFKDLHINSLSLAENYAVYILNYLYNNQDGMLLNFILKEEKIIKQQVPFIKKILVFYLSLNMSKTIDLNRVNHELLKEITSFNEKEVEYLKKFEEGIFDPTLLFPSILAQNIMNHPKAILYAKRNVKK